VFGARGTLRRRNLPDLHYIPFNIADFLADDKVSLMSTEEVGAYILLLCRAWQQERPGSLPDNDEYLATWTRLPQLRWNQIKGKVLLPFWYNKSYPGGEWVQLRMARDHANVTKTLEQRSKAGKKGAEARWSKESMRSQCDGNAKEERVKVKGKSTTKKQQLDWDETGGFLYVTDEQKSGWSEAYPYVDVDGELKKMHQWLVSNPSNRKTRKGLPRFITSWLNRANDLKGSKHADQKRTSEHDETGIGNVINIHG